MSGVPQHVVASSGISTQRPHARPIRVHHAEHRWSARLTYEGDQTAVRGPRRPEKRIACSIRKPDRRTASGGNDQDVVTIRDRNPRSARRPGGLSAPNNGPRREGKEVELHYATCCAVPQVVVIVSARHRRWLSV